MDTRKMTDAEVYERGLEVLLKELGPDEMPRFLQQCKPRTYDYTATRQQSLKNEELDTIVNQIQQEEFERQAEEQVKAHRITAWRNNSAELTELERFEIGHKALVTKLGLSGTWTFFTHHFEHGNHGDSVDAKPSPPETELVSPPRQQVS